MTINITEFKNNLSSKVDSVIKNNKPIKVTTKSGNAILISEANYNSILETIYIMSQPGLVSKIKEGEKEEISKMEKFDSEFFI